VVWRRSRRGISPVVAAVIMTAIMLTTISVAIFYSTSLIDMNRQMMEYEYAKEQLTYAATALEQVAFGAGGARYVRFSLTSTRLDLVSSSGDFVVYANGVQVFAGKLASLRVCGGPLVTTVPRLLYPERGDLSGELGKLVVNASDPIVMVYEEFRGGACAYVQPRVRVFYNAQLSVTEGGASRCYNFFTLHVLNMTRGRVGGYGTIPVIFRNVNLKTAEYRFPGATSVTVEVEFGGREYSLTVRGPAACDSRPVDGSVLVVVRADVEVSTVP
jgi:flagellin-like protein